MIIALVNSKGGVGKSTLAVHLAAALHELGRQPALLDADAQGSSSVWLHEAVPEIPIHRLDSADEIIEAVPELARQQGCLVVDGPAGLSEVTRAILLVADLALLPCGPSALDLRAVREAIRIVRQAQQIRQGPPRVLLVPNKLQRPHRLTRELLATLPALGITAVTGLGLRQAFADAAGQGTLVWRLDPPSLMAAAEMKQLFAEVESHANQTDPERSIAVG